jgi:transposase-like protein
VPRPGEEVRVKVPPAGPPPDWLAKARELYAGGQPLDQVGKAVGKTGNTVARWFRRHGIEVRKPCQTQRLTARPPPKPLPWLADAVRLYGEGLSLAQVADKVGVCDRRVSEIFRREGVQLRPRPVARLTPDEAHDVVLLHRHGHSLERIAGLMKVTPWAIRKVLDYAKRHPAGEAAPDAAQKGQS